MEGFQTRWVKLVPIKVNVFAWRLALNKLPTRFNMSSRGLEIPSIVCPVCNVGAETVDHLFFSCSVASSIMAKVLGWWGFLESGISSYHSWFLGSKQTASVGIRAQRFTNGLQGKRNSTPNTRLDAEHRYNEDGWQDLRDITEIERLQQRKTGAQEGRSKVETWSKMKKLLCEKFLPVNHRQESFLEYHGLSQRTSTVEEFIAEFDRLRMRCGFEEPEEQVIARFLGALRPEISDIVQLQPYWTFNDV
ncbi:RNA-directed DNA polymerase, eukaryota [Tanacetum coccineum]